MDRELDILIVEDVADDAAAIEDALRREGLRFRARRLQTRAEFLAALQHATPEVVLSDFNLPEFDGLEALHLLQQYQPDIPFILVTARRSEEVAVDCMHEGADDYILKDTLKRLPSAIQNALRKKAAEREKARAEAALRRSEGQFRLITENTRDLVSLLDLQGRYLYASPSFHKALGYEPAELLGADPCDLVHPDDQAHFRQAWQEALTHKDQRAAEVRLRHREGSWLIFESIGNCVFDEAGRPQRFVLVSRDITRRKQAEEQLRSLPRLIVEAQESERRRVARELHDSVNQVLASVKFRLALMEETLFQKDENCWRETLKTKALLEKAISEVIRISQNLRPSELDDLGLAAAVRTLCHDFADRTRVVIHPTFHQLPGSFDKETELNVYRIIQEALSNVEKHAQATRVDLRLAREGGLLKVAICDNGLGFEPAAPRARQPGGTGMGLVDMQERAAFGGGRLTLRSAPGQGTEIVVSMPLPAEPLPNPNAKPKSREKSPTKKDQGTARR
jgi:two-component system sensor histidine kinase UhpB